MGVYEAIFRENLSGHYFEGLGDLLWQGLGSAYDSLVSAGKFAVRQRFPFFSLPDALPCIAQNQGLDYPARFVGTGKDQLYLLDPWDKYANDATVNRMIVELQFLGYENVGVVTYRDLVDGMGQNPTTTFGGIASFWYLHIDVPSWFQDANLWDDGHTWDDGSFWDLENPQLAMYLSEIWKVIDKWKPATTSCRYIEIVLPSGRVVTIPKWEWWEINYSVSPPSAPEFYNETYTTP